MENMNTKGMRSIDDTILGREYGKHPYLEGKLRRSLILGEKVWRIYILRRRYGRHPHWEERYERHKYMEYRYEGQP